MAATTVKEILERIAGLDPEKLQGLNAVALFDLGGEGGGKWYAVFKDGTCAVTEGVSKAAHATIRMDASDYVDLATGRLGGMRAFLTGRVKTSGDATLLKKMQSWFPR